MNLQARDVGVTALKGCGCLLLFLVVLAVVFPIIANPGRRPRPFSCMANMSQVAKAMLAYTTEWDDKFPCTRAPGVANGLQPEQGIEARGGVSPFGGTTWVEKIDTYVKKGSMVDGPKGIMSGVFNCGERAMKWTGAEDIRDYHSYGYNFLYLGLPWGKDDSPKTNPYRAWKFISGAPRVSSLDKTSDTILLVESRSIWAFPPFTNDGPPLPVNRTCISPRHDKGRRVNVAFCDGHVKAMDPRDLVTKGRTAKNRQLGRAPDNRLWDPVKTEYQEVSE